MTRVRKCLWLAAVSRELIFIVCLTTGITYIGKAELHATLFKIRVREMRIVHTRRDNVQKMAALNRPLHNERKRLLEFYRLRDSGFRYSLGDSRVLK